jgi:predicted O-methyltransferase YrrM
MGKDQVSASMPEGKSYSAATLAGKYLQYYLTAANGKGHGAHSPFVFHFITRILNDRREYPEYLRVEATRKKMLADQRTVSVKDLGAGSGKGGSRQSRVSEIARRAAKPPKYGQLLFRMVRAWKPGTVLELGTSLGITTTYLSLANTAATLVTIEGAPAVAAIARENLRMAGSVNTDIREGNFDDHLAALVAEVKRLDFVFVDGNHLEEPTVRYFQQLLQGVHNDTVIVFDDIHWSRGMEAAWEKIKSNPAVRCSIDLFFIGIVFFRREFMEKQHFTIRF